MHPYVVESKERTNVIILLLVVGGAGALLCHRLLNLLGVASVPWWIETPSPLAVYGIAYLAFDRWLWKGRFFRWLGLVRTPDLSGAWRGQLHSFGESGEHKCDATVTIKQTWTAMRVCLVTEKSRSVSDIAAIVDDGSGQVTLIHTYLNEPRPGAVGTMHAHRGTACLEVEDGGMTFDGYYYTGRDRVTHGTMLLKRVA